MKSARTQDTIVLRASASYRGRVKIGSLRPVHYQRTSELVGTPTMMSVIAVSG